MHEAKWALITGATGGIGRAFAERFAREGYHLIVTGTRETLLRNMRDDLTRRYGVEVIVHSGDLSEWADQDEVIELAQSKQICVLVNNAGLSDAAVFSAKAIEDILDRESLHVVSTLRLTHALLPSMRSRNEGTVINIAPDVVHMARKGTVHSGTEVFLKQFTHRLQLDSSGKNLYVQALCPGLTRADWQNGIQLGDRRQKGRGFLHWQEPQEVVEKSMRAMKQKKTVCTCDPSMKWRIALTSLLSEQRYRELVWGLNQ